MISFKFFGFASYAFDLLSFKLSFTSFSVCKGLCTLKPNCNEFCWRRILDPRDFRKVVNCRSFSLRLAGRESPRKHGACCPLPRRLPLWWPRPIPPCLRGDAAWQRGRVRGDAEKAGGRVARGSLATNASCGLQSPLLLASIAVSVGKQSRFWPRTDVTWQQDLACMRRRFFVFSLHI